MSQLSVPQNFHIQATEWLKSQSYVKRAAWLGCFAVSSPPDSFAAARNAFFNSGGALRKWASFYIWSNSAKREIADSAAPAARTPGALRHHNARSHRAAYEFEQEMLRRDDDEDDEDDGVTYENEAEHCEELCQKRKQVLEALGDDDELDDEDDLGDVANWVE